METTLESKFIFKSTNRVKDFFIFSFPLVHGTRPWQVEFHQRNCYFDKASRFSRFPNAPFNAHKLELIQLR